MKTPSAIILISVVLVIVSTLAILNSACKSGRHGWCAAMEWLASPEGKAATAFEVTSVSRWGEAGRS